MENTKQQSAVEWLFNELDNILELYPSEWEKVSKAVEQAKEMEKQQLQSEQIAKEHFRKQRDEGLLEQEKQSEEWWSDLSDKFYESNLVQDYKDGKIDFRFIRNWFIEQFKNK